jgi:HK97 family phage major capsid protein
MKSSKFYTEERSLVIEEMETIVSVAETEGRDLLDEEKETFDALNEKAEGLKADAERALKMETMKANNAKNVVSEEDKVKRSYSFFKHIDGILNNNLDGAEKEVQEQAVNEARSAGRNIQGAGIPASMFEKRADITSNIAGLAVEGFVDAIREEAIYTRLGADFLNLTSDARIPVIGKNSTAWMSGENAAAADGGAALSSVTLTPKRIAGYANISKELLHQNGESVERAVMADLGKSVADNICDAMFSSANVTNAPTAIAQTSGVLTFTETGSYADAVSMFADLVLAEQELAENGSLSGSLAYVLHPTFLNQLKRAAQVSGVNPAMAGMDYQQQMVNGYPVYYSSHVGASAGTSADGLFCDWSQVKVGMFGGVDILVDPYTVAINNQVRLVVNTLVDFALPQGGRAVKFTSLTA